MRSMHDLDLLVLDSADGSAGVVQRKNGRHGEDGVEWVHEELGVLTSQP